MEKSSSAEDLISRLISCCHALLDKNVANMRVGGIQDPEHDLRKNYNPLLSHINARCKIAKLLVHKMTKTTTPCIHLDLPPRWNFLEKMEQEEFLNKEGMCSHDEHVQNKFACRSVHKMRSETSWVKRLSFILSGPSVLDEEVYSNSDGSETHSSSPRHGPRGSSN